MKLRKVGEQALLKHIKEKFYKTDKKILIGIGDDTAAIQPDNSKVLLLTTDSLVEGSHFILEKVPPFNIGWKAICANLSDIASMGGTPLFALVNIGIDKNKSFFFFDKLLEGINNLAKIYKTKIVGGDIIHSEKLFISITLIGEIERENIMQISKAKDNDLIFITDYLGNSTAGFKIIMEGNSNLIKKYKNTLVKAHLLPFPKIFEGQLLSKLKYITSCTDLSDSLSQELIKLSNIWGKGIIIEENALPISPELLQYCNEQNINPLELIFGGGEDFQLLFTLPSHYKQSLINTTVKKKLKITQIGTISSKTNRVLLQKSNGKLVEIKKIGFEHF